MLLFKWKHHQNSRFGEWLVVLDDGRLLFRRITRGNNVAWDGQSRFGRLDGPGRFFRLLGFRCCAGARVWNLLFMPDPVRSVFGESVWTDQERHRSAWLFGTASIPELTFDNLEQQIAMAPGQKARALRARLLAPPPAAPPTAPGQDDGDDDDDDDDGYVWV